MKEGKNMTNLQIAVKVISDGLERELSDYDYYKEYNITNWSQMLNAFNDAFGWNSKDVKNEIIKALQIYSNENNVNCNLSNLTSYRELISEVKKELKNRKIFR